MRLLNVARGRRGGRIAFAFARLLSGRDVPDIIKVRFYRSRFFGKPFFRLAQALLRGPSLWTIGERELFAAVVSTTNRCQFCAITHEAVAAAVGNPAATTAVAEPILGLLKKLTLTPDLVAAADVRKVLDAGVSPEAIREAIEVCALFNTINRVADALDFALPSTADRAFNTRVLLKLGYR